MVVDYQYSSDGRDYYRVIWKGNSKHIYIPSGLGDSVFKRGLLAKALLMARRKFGQELLDDKLMQMAARLGNEQAAQETVLEYLERKNVVSFYLTKDKKTVVALEEYDRYYEAELDLSQVLSLIRELQDIADKMPTEQ